MVMEDGVKRDPRPWGRLALTALPWILAAGLGTMGFWALHGKANAERKAQASHAEAADESSAIDGDETQGVDPATHSVATNSTAFVPLVAIATSPWILA